MTAKAASLCVLLAIGHLSAAPKQDAAVAPPLAFRSHVVGAVMSAASHGPKVIVIKEADDLRRLEALIGKNAWAAIDVPALKTDIFLWVFSGQRPSTGYEILVVRTLRKENPARLCLEVRELPPDITGWGGDPALTYPYALISVPRDAWTGAIEVVDARGHLWKAALHPEFQAP
jgi:hypothetical protein